MTSPRERKAALAARYRKRASAQRQPLRRATSPLVPASTVLVFTHNGQLAASVPKGTTLAAGLFELTAELVHEVLTAEDVCLVPVDAQAKRSLEKLLTVSGAQEHRRAYAAVVSTGNPFSVRTLTSALEHLWWAPEEIDARDVDGWAEAFSVTTAARPTMLRQLAVRAAHTTPEMPGTPEAIIRSESRLAESARYTGLAQDCRLHTTIEQIATAQSDFLLSDPGLLGLHELDGSVCRIVGGAFVGSNTYRFTAASPFRSKAGRTLLITDGESSIQSADSGLRSTSYENGALHLELTLRGRDVNWVRERVKANTPLYVREKPFLGFSGRNQSGGSPTGRWQRPSEAPERVPDRQVPLDVLLAGGPVED